MIIDLEFNIGDTVFSEKNNEEYEIDRIFGDFLCEKTYKNWYRNDLTYCRNSISEEIDDEWVMIQIGISNSKPKLIKRSENLKQYNTKYNFGDTLYYMNTYFHNNKLKYHCGEYYSFKLTKIKVDINNSNVKYSYMGGNNACGTVHSEDDVFKSLSECIEVADRRCKEWNDNKKK